MLNFLSFNKLDKHQKYLQDKCNVDNLFLVWWCIRDLLLNIEKEPKDIDFTMAWEPTEIYNNINKKEISHFITEKFGTITLIPKDQKTKTLLQYELTPLRTENEYSDNRHPEKINRQDDLISDSNRRDFTINSLYYFSQKLEKIKPNISNKLTRKNISDTESIQKSLNKNWILFYQDQNLLIIQNHDYIQKLFPKSKFNIDFFHYILDTLKDVYTKQKKSKTNNIFRIIIDPHKGLNDLIDKKIKAVWDPDNRFSEDALRIIRALRFVSVLNQKLKDNTQKWEKIKLFDINPDTWTSLKNHTDLIKNISNERIKEELTKVFSKWDPFAMISLLDEIKLLEYIFPALHYNKNSEQPVRYHPFDTYVHTLLTLYELQKINNNYLVRFAMLYHDVGKHDQYSQYQKSLSRDEIREILAWPLNHRNSGPEFVKRDFSKLWFSKNEIKTISWYVKNHHVPGEILDAKPENRSKRLRKLYSEAGFDMVNDLLDVTIADRLWQYNPMQNSSDISDVEDLRILLKQLQKEEWQFTSKDLKIDGQILMDHFKLKPGPQLWELLKQAMDRVMTDIKNRNKKTEILQYLKSLIKAS